MELVFLKEVSGEGVRIAALEDGKELGHAYLYVLRNDLHDKPFGFMEDVFVEENSRGRGIGSLLVNEVIAEARRRGCYKLIATSRHTRKNVHELYRRLGFREHGLEFRIDF
jgi:GNAT superfamily N-acetyltransferase